MGVQGHVDEAGKILEFKKEGDSLWVKISLSDDLLPFVVPKGYFAVDGTSLTVCEVDHVGKWFNLMLIAHTQQCVIMPKKKIGDKVNLEADCLGKYAASAVGPQLAALKRRVQRAEGLAVAAALSAFAAVI